MKKCIKTPHQVRDLRGSLAVETAIFLPLFLIGVLTLAYLIRICGISENVYHSLADETVNFAAQRQTPVPSASFKKDLTSRVMLENNKDINSASVDKFIYRTPYVDISTGRIYTNLIAVTLSTDVNYRIPRLFRNSDDLSLTVISRAFVGRRNQAQSHTSFEDMEEKDDSKLVWVFPRAGAKFHGENCSHIKNQPREYILGNNIRNKYKPCKLCKPNSEPNGRLVYCFPNTGSAYHIGSCYTVEKYVISMSEDEATSEGYSACKTCGGG
jgi:hypothetical protein